MRWIASLVAEAHRILMRGGVFLYPRDTKDPARPGRLRLLYEANPIGFVMEQAGGRASTGRQPVLGVMPSALHQRIGVVFGSKHEVERIERYHHEPSDPGGDVHRCSPSAACSATNHASPGLCLRPIATPMGARSALRRPGARPRTSPCQNATPSSPSPAPPAPARAAVTRTFENIFRRENISAAVIEGDSFHRYDRKEMRARQAEAEQAGDKNFSHFGPDNNLFPELENLFRSYGETGTGKRRRYLHDPVEAAPYQQDPGTFTPWEDLPDEHRHAVLRRPARRGGHASR